MKIRNLIIAMLAGIFLTACTVEAHPDRSFFGFPGVFVEKNHHGKHHKKHNGKHCPPGHAKKGHC